MDRPPKKSIRTRLKRALAWVRRNVPPGVRLVLGAVLMVGGVFGFLPVLGFWMIPMGFAIAALDVVPMWRFVAARIRGR